LVFVFVFTALQLTWQSLRDTAVENFVIHTCTVVPAAFFLNRLTPEVHAEAVHFTLRAPGGGLNILNGCDGLEALFLLVAAFAVAPVSGRSRLTGLTAGVPIVFAVNQIRILALFYAYRVDPALFDSLHAMVAPILVILVVASYFYAWLAHSARRAPVSP
jgi:exosortase family protein XrtM